MKTGGVKRLSSFSNAVPYFKKNSRCTLKTSFSEKNEGGSTQKYLTKTTCILAGKKNEDPNIFSMPKSLVYYDFSIAYFKNFKIDLFL